MVDKTDMVPLLKEHNFEKWQAEEYWEDNQSINQTISECDRCNEGIRQCDESTRNDGYRRSPEKVQMN